ncbi:proteasome assembly chaperone 4-like [Babylonia areolata]|uniref:proteasome assembly chaperone 4-like n=1 Tax=Babylonia areolata TaxID=304850 RepID=UPI003FD61040
MEGKESLNIVDAAPQISVHNFSDMILGNQMFFHVIKLSESFHICIGSSPVLKNMAVAMQTKYDKGTASGSILFGDTSDPVSLNMAQKLAKRTGKQVFVSCSVPYDQNQLPLIEKRISEEITSHPDCF